MIDEMRLLTQQEVAAILHCEAHKVTALRRTGLLKGAKFGKRWVYREKDVMDFVEKSIGIDYSDLSKLSEKGIEKIRKSA